MAENDSEHTDSTVMEVKNRQSRKAIESNFAPCFKVTLKGGETVLVPIDKASSDNKRLILVAKARELVENQIDKMADLTMTPAELKDVVKAVTDLDALQREQYITGLNASSPTGKALQGIIKSAAAGAAEGSMAFMEQMRKMDAAAKAVTKQIEEAKTKTIDV